MNKQQLKLTYASLAALATMAATFAPIAFYARKHHESLSDFIRSSRITADIKARLLTDRDIPGNKISVTTVNGIVTLAGIVGTHEQKQKALFTAHQAQGVLSVFDNLVVEMKRF